jgi:hypothetical protein
MTEAIRSSETSVLTRPTLRNSAVDGILQRTLIFVKVTDFVGHLTTFFDEIKKGQFGLGGISGHLPNVWDRSATYLLACVLQCKKPSPVLKFRDVTEACAPSLSYRFNTVNVFMNASYSIHWQG